ncbi:MAG: cell division protein ZapE [Gammaproteobacteria bacterium]|nr:MAG: cell division protein ZapE [Gammaproteobacteria bacterium]
MTPQQKYQHYLTGANFQADPAQAAAVVRLDDLYHRLCAVPAKRGLLGKIADRVSRRPITPVMGLYLWGGVGRGKTFLMDVLFDCLPFDAKVRMHFHRFMRRVHHDLRELAGTPNPLEQVAARLAAEARVLCFDEFFVSDIGDAMILSELLDGLFRHGVCLIATSNIAPDALYEHGLQRQRFLPAIALLEKHTESFNLDGETDFRLRLLERAEIYHAPLDDAAEAVLAGNFAALAPDPDSIEHDLTLEIEGRPIACRRCGDDVAWFEFDALCDGPRSANDYIELARIFHAVLLSGVPVFTARREDQARRFISLVDEFYDRNVKLIASAEAPIESLYQGKLLEFEFRRTRSRLLEMQSYEYLGRSHRP